MMQSRLETRYALTYLLFFATLGHIAASGCLDMVSYSIKLVCAHVHMNMSNMFTCVVFIVILPLW